MMGVRTIMSMALLYGLLGLTAADVCLADETIEVVRSEGVLQVGEPDKQATDAKVKRLTGNRYVFSTGANGRAVVRVGNAGFVVVERNSSLEVDRSSGAVNLFRQVSGMIYYAMNKVQRSTHKVKIKTTTAVIGVRGTRFVVVDEAARKEIGMRKGEISVTSPNDEYEIHRRQVDDEFDAYKKEARDAIAREKKAYEDYRAETAREFIEYKREFTLAADRMVSFDGNKVTEGALNEKTKQDMESLESFGAEWIGTVHD
ncbi:MAG: FecR domain-containing protein [Sideroxydans sp.]|nr:FecR domain-containing protein [Sideroxydans sp.]